MKFLIQPMPGKVVRDPDSVPIGRILEPSGIEVDILTPHWRRRENEGGVSVTWLTDATTPAPAIANTIAPDARKV